MSGTRTGTQGGLMSFDLAAQCIRSGRALCVAGDEAVLARLPRGNWIGGTTPYFVGAQGGICSRERVFVHLLPPDAGEPTVKRYDADSLANVCTDAPTNGFTLLVLPGTSDILERYALQAPGYDDMYLRPLVGWVSGVHHDEHSKRKPKVVHGASGEAGSDFAVALHVPLPAERRARVHLLNPYQVPADAPVIRFPRQGFSAVGATVNHASVSLGRYYGHNAIDTRLPLVADDGGARVNVAVAHCDSQSGMVTFYGPVFEGVDYRIAAPVEDLAAAIEAELPHDGLMPAFACCSLLNYENARLEGRALDPLTGPVGFGEIAYQLVNQSLVYLTVE